MNQKGIEKGKMENIILGIIVLVLIFVLFISYGFLWFFILMNSWEEGHLEITKVK